MHCTFANYYSSLRLILLWLHLLLTWKQLISSARFYFNRISFFEFLNYFLQMIGRHLISPFSYPLMTRISLNLHGRRSYKHKWSFIKRLMTSFNMRTSCTLNFYNKCNVSQTRVSFNLHNMPLTVPLMQFEIFFSHATLFPPPSYIFRSNLKSFWVVAFEKGTLTIIIQYMFHFFINTFYYRLVSLMQVTYYSILFQ